MAAPLYTTSSGLLWHAGKILIVVAGLPARGKTHISRSLERYLRWNGVTIEVFSLGDYRRKLLGHAKDLPPDYFTYGPRTDDTASLRNSVRSQCERDILDFFDQAGQVAIYDANNGTRESRKKLYDKFHPLGFHVIFLESVCTNQDIVLANIRSVKISSPDYTNWNPDQAVEDYMTRIAEHERHYQPVEEMDIPWIRLFNVGERIQINKIQGYLQSRIVFFLMNIHNKQRFIYFARSGQSLIEHSYRADSDLSPAGWDYARRLKNFMMERRYLNMEERRKANGGIAEDRNLVIWTSSRRRSHHTAWPFIKDATMGTIMTDSKSPSHTPNDLPQTQSPARYPNLGTHTPEIVIRTPAEFDQLSAVPHEEGLTVNPAMSPPPPPGVNLPSGQAAYGKIKVIEKSRLCEINPGVWDGLSPDDVRSRYPLEWENFLRDPYGHRAPRAESYHDLCIRLEPILIELEDCKDDLLIISHASVIRCLLAYLVGLPAHEVPAVDIARGDLIEVQPSAYGVKTRMFHFWSGPGRKDGETINGGLEGEMREKQGRKESVDPSVSSQTNSPPKSDLHLDRCYKSKNPSLASLSDSLKITTHKTGEGQADETWTASEDVMRGTGLDESCDTPAEEKDLRNRLESKSPPTSSIELPKPQPPTQQQSRAQTLPLAHHINSPPTLKAPPSHLREVITASTEDDDELESPTHASKVLPKVETSLGADEAGRVAAKIEAADTRPTFYENIMEGTVKRKKPASMATTPAKGTVALPSTSTGTTSPSVLPSPAIPLSTSPPALSPSPKALSLGPPALAVSPSSILSGTKASAVPLLSMDAMAAEVTGAGNASGAEKP